MIFRFILLVLLATGGFYYWHSVADQETKDSIAETVLTSREKAEETKVLLIEKKNILEATLLGLQTQLQDKVQAGQDKVEEVSLRIKETKEAIDEAERSIKALNESLGLSKSDEDEEESETAEEEQTPEA